MPSRIGPNGGIAPWQSSGPNELISQLEALDGGTGATWGRLQGQREGGREREGGRGARERKMEVSSPTW